VVNRGGRSLTVIPTAAAGTIAPVPAAGSTAAAAAEPLLSAAGPSAGVFGSVLPLVAAGTAVLVLGGAGAVVVLLGRRRKQARDNVTVTVGTII